MSEKHQRPDEKEISSSIKRLKQQFGRHLDDSVLEAILEMHEFKYNLAENFLRAENQNTGYDLQAYNPNDQHNQAHANNIDSILPENYHKPPANFDPMAFKPANINIDSVSSSSSPATAAAAEPETEATKIRDLFMKQSTFQEHFIYQRDHLINYLSTLLVLTQSGMEIKDGSKARALAALWAHKKYRVADFLLNPANNLGLKPAQQQTNAPKYNFGFGLTEVLKAINLLDANRKIRVLEKRLALLQRQQKVKPRTLGRVQSSINDLKREPVQGSLSGALIRHIRKWAQTLSSEDLRFFAIHLPREPWKELADLLHLNPQKDFKEPWFLGVTFGEPAPEGTVVADCVNLTQDNILEVVQKHNPPYAFLRKHKGLLNHEVIARVATYTPLETLVWFYEEVRCPEVDQIIQQKLDVGEQLVMGYGKLMERLLTFKSLNVPFFASLIPHAEAKLQSIKLPLKPPVVCFGDASYSMDVAIRVSTIIASLMTALTNADLRFFNTESIVPPLEPRTIADVLELTMTVRADKLTAPAAALKEYYDKRLAVNTFIIVTDEVENLPYEGDYFAQLFYKYKKEVHPAAQIVFVSFLPNQNVKGRMVKSLEMLGITPRLEMRLDGTRPDLTKLDSMLVALSSETDNFLAATDLMAQKLGNGDEKNIVVALQNVMIQE